MYLTDEYFMRFCMQEAVKGKHFVTPNPLVGAVLAYNQKIIGIGFHAYYGGPHAEVNCINSVEENDKKWISDATLYISLEPCAHYGKTPPCVDFILKQGIQKVVIASIDPNPNTKNKGIQKLIEHGVDVKIGCLDEEQRLLNRSFYTFFEQNRTYIRLKWARSKDSFIGIEKKQIKISSPSQDEIVHSLRAMSHAILVGTDTVLVDNPFLNTRIINGRSPIPILLDRQLRLPDDLNVYKIHPLVYILNGIKNEVINNKYYVKCNNFSPKNLIKIFYDLKIQSVLIEGGAKILQSFIDEEIGDEIHIFEGETFIEKGIKEPIIEKNDFDIKIYK